MSGMYPWILIFLIPVFLSSDVKDRRSVIPVYVLQFETDMVSVILLLILVSSLQDHAKVSFYSV